MIQVRILAGQLRAALSAAACASVLTAAVPSAGALPVQALVPSFAAHSAPGLAPFTLTAQARADRDAASAADSAALHRAAREAQARFERVRRRHLPLSLGTGGGSCDERIGRFCFRHTPGYRWRPPPEAPEVVAARRDLLDRLEAVARRIPGDRWVLGQRVRYLTEHGDWEAALAPVPADCAVRPEGSCAELRGLVLHHLGRYEEAETAFLEAERAVSDADVGGRAADAPPRPPGATVLPHPGPLVDEATRRDLLAAAPGAARVADGRDGRGGRGADLDLFWWLADPLHLVPGNDRRTAHRARAVHARLREDAATTWSLPWGDDLGELVLRYGPEIGWQRAPPAPLRGREIGVVGHQHPEAREFVPPTHVLEDPWSVEPGAWSLEADRPRSAWAPPYAQDIRHAEGAVSVLREGDSVVVLALVRHGPPSADPPEVGGDPEAPLLRTPPDSLLPWRGAPEQVGLFLRGEDGSEHGVRGPVADPGRRGLGAARTGRSEAGVIRPNEGAGAALLLRVPAGRYVVSLERWDPAEGLASRNRFGLVERRRPPDVPVLSDLVVLDPAPSDPESPEALLPRLRPGEVLRRGEEVSLAWQLHGLGWRGEERIGYRLTLEPADRGRLRRAAEWLGLAEPERGLSLEWSERGPPRPGPVLRSLDVRVPPLEPGRYRLVLRVDLPGRSALRAERVVRVVESAGGR